MKCGRRWPTAGVESLGDYLISLDHQRFLAVARYDWPQDVDLLRRMVESDPAVKDVVEQEVMGQVVDRAADVGL